MENRKLPKNIFLGSVPKSCLVLKASDLFKSVQIGGVTSARLRRDQDVLQFSC